MTQSIDLTDDEYRLILNIREKKKRNPDYVLWDFDDNLEKVLKYGKDVKDRTGVGCRVLSGVTSAIDISKRVPVPTRRATTWKSMLLEYLWFVSGSHNINDLNKMGSRVWDFWRDDQFTQANNFPEGSIGYGYGFNLIHFGGDIRDVENNPGFNQLDYVLDLLQNEPTSRRILFIFYRPDRADKNSVKLPACHVAYQFIPTPDNNGDLKHLNCCVYQRSSDAFVGNLSTNLQGAAFLTHMLARHCGMKPKTLTHFSANFHIYKDHIPLVEEYLKRDAPNSPVLRLNHKPSIYAYTADDFVLEDYHPLERQKVPIAI